MARKNIIAPYQLSEGQVLVDFTTAPTIVPYLDNVAYQINITDPSNDSFGFFYVQASLDYEVDISGNVVNPGTWAELNLGGGGVPHANGVSDNILISLNQVPYNALRITYIQDAPGTGTCDIFVMAKQVGG